MNATSKISARETIVIDENEIDQLDEISLTSVMRQLTDPAEPSQSQHTDERRDPPTAPYAPERADSTINELLSSLAPMEESLKESTYAHYGDAACDAELSDEAVDELLSADVLFPDREED